MQNLSSQTPTSWTLDCHLGNPLKPHWEWATRQHFHFWYSRRQHAIPDNAVRSAIHRDSCASGTVGYVRLHCKGLSTPLRHQATKLPKTATNCCQKRRLWQVLRKCCRTFGQQFVAVFGNNLLPGVDRPYKLFQIACEHFLVLSQRMSAAVTRRLYLSPLEKAT